MSAAESLRHFLPETFLLASAFLALAADWFTARKRAIGGLALFALAGYFLLNKFRVPAETLGLFQGAFLVDRLTRFAGYLVPLVTFLTVLSSLDYRPLPRAYEGEYYALFLFMAFALLLMAASSNLLMIFLSIEFVSLLSYLMVGLLKKDARSKEAAVKYLLFGSAASAVMLYGMSLAYGAAGSMDLRELSLGLRDPGFRTIALLSLVFFLVGLGFKISMAPFHLWAPDVYEAAPTPVTAFLTVAPKAMGFIVLIRVLGTAFASFAFEWRALVSVLSILTMTVGNLTAVSQTNLKRLIAYSSIAQAGYLLMGIAVFGSLGIRSVLIYLVAYAFTNLGVFTVILAVSNHAGNDLLSSYSGLAKRAPGLAAALTLFLLSLAGLPPLAGFIAKFYVFSGAIRDQFFGLAVAAALNSAVAAYYYFRIVKAMYLAPAEEAGPVACPWPLRMALGIALAGALVFGLLPHPLIAFIESTIL